MKAILLCTFGVLFATLANIDTTSASVVSAHEGPYNFDGIEVEGEGTRNSDYSNYSLTWTFTNKNNYTATFTYRIGLAGELMTVTLPSGGNVQESVSNQDNYSGNVSFYDVIVIDKQEPEQPDEPSALQSKIFKNGKRLTGQLARLRKTPTEASQYKKLLNKSLIDIRKLQKDLEREQGESSNPATRFPLLKLTRKAIKVLKDGKVQTAYVTIVKVVGGTDEAFSN